VAKKRATGPFGEEVRDLLTKRRMSVRALAEEIDFSAPFVQRVVQGTKPPTTRLVAAVCHALDLPEGYFAEAREASVVERVRNDPRLRDRLYDSLSKRGQRGQRPS